EREDVGRDRGRQPVDLLGRLDEGPGMRVERDPRSGGTRLLGDLGEDLDRPAPAVVGQARCPRVVRASGPGVPFLRPVEGDAEDVATARPEEADPLADLLERAVDGTV